MSRSFKSLVIALSGAGFLAGFAGDVQACHPRARGGYGGGHQARVVVVRAPQQQYQQVQQQLLPYGQPYNQPGVVQGSTGQVGVQFQGQQLQSQQLQGQQFAGQQFQGQQVPGQQIQGQATSAALRRSVLWAAA